MCNKYSMFKTKIIESNEKCRIGDLTLGKLIELCQLQDGCYTCPIGAAFNISCCGVFDTIVGTQHRDNTTSLQCNISRACYGDFFNPTKALVKDIARCQLCSDNDNCSYYDNISHWLNLFNGDGANKEIDLSQMDINTN